LEDRHRPALDPLLRSTAVFSDAEIAVALELAESDDPDYQFLAATVDDALAGYACYGPTPGTDRGYDLYWIAVRPDAQRGGIGSALLAEVEARITGDNARVVVIETSSRPPYAPTRQFYMRHGYAEVARVREFYGLGDDRIVYTKRLQAAPRVRGGGDESL
jgi:GNAT superfamily N-acetyltransferase